MSTRRQILERALFDTGGEVAGIKFGPLSPPVLMILKRRRNSLLVESDRDQDENEALAEILYVLSRTHDERQAMFRDSDAVWQDKALLFMSGLPDRALEDFAELYLGPAMNALKMAQTESEGPGKSGAAPSPATSLSSTRGRGVRESTSSPEPSASKNPCGDSASALSSNSSSRSRSKKVVATGGSTGLRRRKK